MKEERKELETQQTNQSAWRRSVRANACTDLQKVQLVNLYKGVNTRIPAKRAPFGKQNTGTIFQLSPSLFPISYP